MSNMKVHIDPALALTGRFIMLVYKKLEEAIEQFDLPIKPDDVKITLDVTGRTAGWAIAQYEGVRITRTGEVARTMKYSLRFNREGIEKHWDYMVNNVIPHEVAHLVAYMKPGLGAKHHNAQWKAIDLLLGGNGSRTHSLPLTKARRTRWYIYTITHGKSTHEFKLSSVRHKRLQGAKTGYSINVNGVSMKIHPSHFTGKSIVK